MYVTGTLHYVSSDYGSPVDDLDGEVHRIYLNAEAERTLAKEPYLTNLSSDTAEGYLDEDYYIQIPYAGRLAVQQTLYSTSGTATRTGYAYYDVTVQDIQTNLLYRPERNDRYITLLLSGGILFGLITIFKVVRHD